MQAYVVFSVSTYVQSDIFNVYSVYIQTRFGRAHFTVAFWEGLCNKCARAGLLDKYACEMTYLTRACGEGLLEREFTYSCGEGSFYSRILAGLV